MSSFRGNITAVHGMLFGVFFLLAAYALLVELLRRPATMQVEQAGQGTWYRVYLSLTALCGWAAVLSGTYLVYPWYRAARPAGADLHLYPKALLLSSPATATLHTVGMEWKEHIAFLAPIAFTAVVFVLCRYRTQLVRAPQLRRLLLVFSATALLATAVSAAAGAFLNKAAPVEGPQALPQTLSIR